MKNVFLNTYLIIFIIVSIFIISCDLTEEAQQIVAPPEIPDKEIFELDFTGIVTPPRGYKDADITGWIEGNMSEHKDGIVIEDPFRLAHGFIGDFRRGMISQLSSIFQSTFHNINRIEPEETDGFFVWEFSSSIFDPGKGYPMERSDLKLTADRKSDGTIYWNLFKIVENDQVLIAVGETGVHHLKGKWTFLYHDGLDVPAFEFNWARKREKTSLFRSKLHFVNVEATYEQEGEWFIHTQDRRETVENAIFTEIRWSRRTGEGSIYVRIDAINQDIRRCWNQLRESIDECPDG